MDKLENVLTKLLAPFKSQFNDQLFIRLNQEKIKTLCMQNDMHTKLNIDVLGLVLEITLQTEKQYKCLKYIYDDINDKYYRILYEDYANITGFEPIFDETYTNIKFDDIINEVFQMFINY